MSSGELLSIEPQQLRFPFELKKQMSCSLRLSSKTEDHVAFKMKTTNPKEYCVRPSTGVLMPRSSCDVIITMKAHKEAPPHMQCKDKFLIQSAIATPGATQKDMTPDTFNKKSGNLVEECRLSVVYVAPPQPPSLVQAGSERGSSPMASVADNMNLDTSEFRVVSRSYLESHDARSEADNDIMSFGF